LRISSKIVKSSKLNIKKSSKFNIEKSSESKMRINLLKIEKSGDLKKWNIELFY